MIEFSPALIISSFVAGVFTFFAPCTTPLIPAFLGVISGVGQQELGDPEKLKKLKWKIFSNALFYVIGFSLIFILFGVAFSSLGQIVSIRLWLQRIGGALVIIFGLFLLGVLKIRFLSAGKQIYVPKLFRSANKTNSFGIGALFALGWSPCVGPLLGSVLLLASTSGRVLEGTFLLIIFSLGLAIPFLLTALFLGRAFSAFSKWANALKIINMIAGLFLIGLGVLMVSDQFIPFFNQFKGFFYKRQFFEEFINRFL